MQSAIPVVETPRKARKEPHTEAETARNGRFRRSEAGNERSSAAPAIAWSSILAGALTGLALGLWSFGGPFPTPEWIGSYDALPRRFLRLAHVALFALGILHLMTSRQIAATPVAPALDRLALRAVAFGNIAMPLALIAAAVWEPMKYLTPFPALGLTFAFSVAAIGAVRHSTVRHRTGGSK